MKDKLSITDDFPFNDYYKEYKKLGGNKTRIEYDINLDIFLKQTLEIYVYGNTTQHDTRSKAWNAVIKEAKINSLIANFVLLSKSS